MRPEQGRNSLGHCPCPSQQVTPTSGDFPVNPPDPVTGTELRELPCSHSPTMSNVHFRLFLLLTKVFPFSNSAYTFLKIILIFSSQPMFLYYNCPRKPMELKNRAKWGKRYRQCTQVLSNDVTQSNVCAYVYMFTCMYIHTHTYTHAHMKSIKT